MERIPTQQSSQFENFQFQNELRSINFCGKIDYNEEKPACVQFNWIFPRGLMRYRKQIIEVCPNKNLNIFILAPK